MNKIRIAYIIPSLQIGGCERQLYYLVKNIDKEKFYIKIFCLQKLGYFYEKLKDIVDIELINAKHHYKDLKAIIKLAKILKREKFKIVHTNLHFANTLGRISAIIARVPIILTYIVNIEDWKTWKTILLDKILHTFTTKVIFNSENCRLFTIKNERIKESKTLTIYYGFDLEKFNPNIEKGYIRKKINLPQEIFLIGNIARFVPQKGHRYLIEAAEKVIEENSKVKFLIIGEGNEYGKIKELIREKKLERYFIITKEEPDNIPFLIADLDLFVLTSLREGLPNVIMEAMACKKPVIATDVGGINELIKNNETGILIPPRNSNILAKKIIELIKNSDLCNTLSEGGYKFIKENFSMEKYVQKFSELYIQLVRDHYDRG